MVVQLCAYSAFLFVAMSLASPISAKQVDSPAHEKSRDYIIDPTYNALTLSPAPDLAEGKAAWVYGPDQVEAWMIDRVVATGFAANKSVHYERNYRRIERNWFFRRLWPRGGKIGDTLALRVNGDFEVLADDRRLSSGPTQQNAVTISLPHDQSPQYLRVNLKSDSPAALLIENGPFRTGSGWEASTDGKQWRPAAAFSQTKSGRLPHDYEEPTSLQHPVSQQDGIYDFGVPLLAWPVFRCQGTPSIMSGESLAESKASSDVAESHMDVVQLPDNRWTSKYPLGFRYLRIQGEAVSEVAAEASFHPVQYRGAFACSDPELNRIWMHSTFTLRTCMQRLMLDGIKRDRMPWAGDQASNIIANAYSFGEPEIVRRSLTALGQPTAGYINGIVDYSLWWVITQRNYQLYFDDADYLKQQWPRIATMLDSLSRQCDAEGLLRPAPSAWVFIDWGVANDKQKTITALQILWYWTLLSGGELAKKSGDHIAATRYTKQAVALGNLLQKRAFNTVTDSWKEYLEGGNTNSPYPNLLAVLSGLSSDEQYSGIRGALIQHPGSGTPFMRGFALMALTQTHAPDEVNQRVKAYWGGMLQRGATTFWEDFNPKETDNFAMYNRPFGRSLCHAWSSGPAAILPLNILGVRPLEDGWKLFTVNPRLMGLQWVDATIPTPSGSIVISAKTDGTTVTIPAGLTLIQGDKRYSGPQTVQFATKVFDRADG